MIRGSGWSARLPWLSAVVAGLVGLALLVGATPVDAGDNAAVLAFEPHEVDAEPGETVAVDVYVQSQGGSGGDGVESIAVTLAYDREVLTAVAVDPGPFMEQGEETDVVTETDVDDDAGRATVEQTREPAEGGAAGVALLATVTFEVPEDAPAADAVLQVADADVRLANDHEQPAVVRDGLVRVAGGGQERVPIDEDAEDGPGIVTPEGTATGETGSDSTGVGGSDRADDDAGSEPGGGDAESLPGFGLAPALAALLLAVIAARVRR